MNNVLSKERGMSHLKHRSLYLHCTLLKSNDKTRISRIGKYKGYFQEKKKDTLYKTHYMIMSYWNTLFSNDYTLTRVYQESWAL